MTPDALHPPEGWYTFGAHADGNPPPHLEFSAEVDDAGLPLWERPVPDDPR